MSLQQTIPRPSYYLILFLPLGMAPLLSYVLILLKLVADSTFSKGEVQKAIPEGSSLVELLALGLWMSLPVK